MPEEPEEVIDPKLLAELEDYGGEMDTAALGTFNFVLLQQMMQKCVDAFPAGHTDLEVYANMLHEWCKFMKHLGRGMVVAFKGKYIFQNLIE